MEIINYKTVGIALVGGLIPSIIWLFFWLNQESTDKEPRGALAMVFLLGAISIMLVLPIQQWIQALLADPNHRLVLWAAAEELVKYLAVVVILVKSQAIDEPIDWPIYLITAALGFAAIENTLFLIKPLSVGQTTAGLINGQLRFLGSTLLHSIASGIVGIALGLSMHFSSFLKKIYLLGGLILAIALHSAFNFFIIRNNGSDFLVVFSFLWVTAIIVMLLFEKLRRIS